MTAVANDRLLINVVLEYCHEIGAPTLLKALEMNRETCQTGILFVSNATLSGYPGLRGSASASNSVDLDLEIDKEVSIVYHTEHIVSNWC